MLAMTVLEYRRPRLDHPKKAKGIADPIRMADRAITSAREPFQVSPQCDAQAKDRVWDKVWVRRSAVATDH
ncbi:MAG: hypothetical protein J0H89_14595 [Rhizobiales bacterium]|jgi:hypothetical protein|nr:hypothetical protein [Hyphomicrobiales bacterium]